MTGLYEKAVAFFNAEDYALAKDCLIRIVESSGESAGVLFFLGVIEARLKQYNTSNTMFHRVIELESRHYEAMFNLALNYYNKGESELSLEYFRKALEINPELQSAHKHALLLENYLAKRAEAEMYFSERMYAQSKEVLIELYKENPLDYRLVHKLADTFFHLGEYEKAIEYYYVLISLMSVNEVVLYNIALCYQKLKNYDTALRLYHQSLQMNPSYIDSLNNLGLIYSEMKEFGRAYEYFCKALEIDPMCISAIANIGIIKLQTDEFDEIIRINGKVLSIIDDKYGPQMHSAEMNNKKAIAYCNIGFANYRKGHIDLALEYYGHSIDCSPDYVIAHYNRAQAYLIKGDFKKGFQEYEWRMLKEDWGRRKFHGLPPVEQLSGKRVLVYAEQGLGDAIQFVRYVKRLKQTGCTVIFECDRKLTGLFKNYCGIDEFIERNTGQSPEAGFDYSVALMSLPGYFGTELSDIPCEVPYLTTQKELLEKWNKNINDDGGIKGKLKVGIVWSGNPQHTNDSRRSCRLKHFEDLFELENIQFYSIQVGPASGQVEKYGKKIIDLEVINEDGLAGTAAILSCMDLLISVDTSVAHLAGALGKRTWILLPFLPDWRWMLERRDSPWYPSVKLYRQEAPGDWKSILDKVKCELISETENAKPDRLPQLQETIYLALSSGENFGWGICSKYIKEELSKKVHTLDIAVREELKISTEIPGTVIHALNNPEFDSLYPVRGTRNFGYTFFEYELNQRSVRNAEKYDLVIGGSSWNKDKMIEKGITNADYLIQGIDPKYFYPAGISNTDDLFVIFSGGKFELRKGQDLVLKAVKILQQKYSDIVLINAWYNKWPSTMESMQLSKYIDFEYSSKEWEEFIAGLLHKNGLDKDRIITLPIVPNREMRDIYLKSDIGLFPNRCEGGTNLVMMEYMACGKPVIASFNTGHMDILTDENSIPLKTMHEFRIYNSDKTLIADWSEPDLDEIITEVERAYFNREKIRETGYCAGEYMKQHTWSATAEKLLKLIT